MMGVSSTITLASLYTGNVKDSHLIQKALEGVYSFFNIRSKLDFFRTVFWQTSN